MSNWLQLGNSAGYDFDEGKLFGPFDLINGLAIPLAGINRFGRHQDRDWSVAAHSVAVARTIEAVTGDLDAAAAGLLHDAHEAVVGDIMTPVAWAIDYERIKALKEEVQDAIHLTMEIAPEKHPSRHTAQVTWADAAALEVERQLMMAPSPRPWTTKSAPHSYAVAMYHAVRELLDRDMAFGVRAADIFVYEYARLVNKAG